MKQPNKEKLAKVVELPFLSTAEEQYKFARFYGTFPSRFSTMRWDPFADQPLMKRAMEMLEFAEAVPDHPNWAQIDERIQAELQLIFAGEKTVEQECRMQPGQWSASCGNAIKSSVCLAVVRRGQTLLFR